LKKLLLQYLPYYKHYKLKIAYAAIGVLLVASSTSGIAYVLKPMLDEMFDTKDKRMLAIMPAVIFALYFAKGLGRYLQTYYTSYVGQDIIRQVRDKLLHHIIYLDLSYFGGKHSGELVSRITNDINRIQGAISANLAGMIQNILSIIFLVALVIYHSPSLAFWGLVVMPAALYPLSRLAKKMKKISFSSQSKNADLLSHLNELFNNIEIIKASNAQEMEVSKTAKINHDFFKLNMKAVKTNALVSPIMEIIGAIAFAIIITIGGQQVMDGTLSVGTFFSFVAALFMLYTPIKSLSSQYNGMQDAIAANERVNELFAQQSHITSGKLTFPDEIKEMEFSDIVVKFDDHYALNKVSLLAKKGERIALIGDSGGGKSTLVNTLLRFYAYQDGSLTIDGTSIRDFDVNSLRENISIVTQRVYIFNDTIGANIAYGQPYNQEKVHTALRLAHADQFIDTLPNGIDTILDEFGTNLSGGQRQRIAIARALYKDPQILIFDEATSALDNTSEAAIIDVLDEISKDKITFVIAHRLSTIRDVDKIAVFENGQIVALGSHADLLNRSSKYQKLTKQEK